MRVFLEGTISLSLPLEFEVQIGNNPPKYTSLNFILAPRSCRLGLVSLVMIKGTWYLHFPPNGTLQMIMMMIVFGICSLPKMIMMMIEGIWYLHFPPQGPGLSQQIRRQLKGRKVGTFASLKTFNPPSLTMKHS